MTFYGSVFVLVLAGSCLALIDVLKTRPITDFATAVENGSSARTLDDGFIDRVTRLIDDSDVTCQHLVTQARVTSSLFLLRQVSAQSLRKELVRFDKAVDRALACNPFNGDVWLLSAMNAYRAGDTDRFNQRWGWSISTSRFEGRTLDLRWQLAPYLIASGALNFSDDVQEDLGRIIAYADPASAAVVIQRLQKSQLPAIADRAMSHLSVARRTVVARNVARLNALESNPSLKSPFRSDHEG